MITLISCESLSFACYKNFTDEQRKGIEKLLRHMLFYRNGVFTLQGSKPITHLELIDGPDIFWETFDFSRLDSYHGLKVYINKDIPQEMVFYHNLPQHLQDKTVFFSEEDFIFNERQLLQTLDDFFKNFSLNENFLLLKQEYGRREIVQINPDIKRLVVVYFVNIENLSRVLSRYYQEFKIVFRRDFDPALEAKNLAKNSSPLRKYLESTNTSYFKNFILGLLFGYGYENALTFSWEMRLNTVNNPMVKQVFSSREGHSIEQEVEIFPKPYSYSNFSLPIFSSYQDSDPKLQKYAQEKSMILDYYRNRDFTKAALKILCK